VDMSSEGRIAGLAAAALPRRFIVVPR
jgi:hypothetical protein